MNETNRIAKLFAALMVAVVVLGFAATRARAEDDKD
jgi:hypothetical protein